MELFQRLNEYELHGFDNPYDYFLSLVKDFDKESKLKGLQELKDSFGISEEFKFGFIKMKVWHIPQVPGKAFEVIVSSCEEAVKIQDVLSSYDQFQLDNDIKPDYFNMSGVCMWSEELQDWVDFIHEINEEYFETPQEYLEWKNQE